MPSFLLVENPPWGFPAISCSLPCVDFTLRNRHCPVGMYPNPTQKMSRLYGTGGSSHLQLQDADDGVQLADFGHALDQILLHRHNQIPPKIRIVFGWGLRTVDRPRVIRMLFAFLLADNSAHLADGLHTADQVLLQSHFITS